MHPPVHSSFHSSRWFILFITFFLLTVSCSPPAQQHVSGPGSDYEKAKDMFKQGRFDRCVEITNALTTGSSPNSFTERARVLQAVVYAGMLDAYKELAEAYAKGADKSKNPRFKSEYNRLRGENLQYATRAALGLAETAHQITMEGTVPKEVTLEAAYPSTEGPMEVQELQRVQQGGWIEPEQQESASIEAVRKGIDNALAGIVAGDRSQARTALARGSAKIDGVGFAIFLGNRLVDGAVVFDRKHYRDSQRLKTLCTEAEEATSAAEVLLKESPNAEKSKQIKKLQDRIKTTLKNL